MMREKVAYKNDRVDKIKDIETYTLTKAEKAIVNLIECGFSNKEIAKILSKSEKTVKHQLSKVYAKLNIKNRYQLIVCIGRTKGLRNRYKFQS